MNWVLLSIAVVSCIAAACGGASGDATPTATSAPEATPTARALPSATVDISIVADWLKPAFDDSPDLPGVYVAPSPGPDGSLLTRDDFEHFSNGVRRPICSDQQVSRHQIDNCYNSNPPTSGPHAASPAQFRVYQDPVPKENLVHSMEHGGIVIWYNTTNAAAIAMLTEIANDAIAARKLVVMTPYADMEPDTIAITAWTRLDKFTTSQLTPQRVLNFIAVHERRFNPEGF